MKNLLPPFNHLRVIVDISYNLGPLLRRCIAWKLVVEVAVPQEGKHAAHKAYFYLRLS